MPGYQSSYGGRRHRRMRPRGAGRQPEIGDAIVSALTIQVIICILLILAFVLYKKSNEEKYRDFKAGYTDMAANPGGLEDVAEALDDGAESFSGILQSIETYFQDLVRGWFGDREELPRDTAPPQILLGDPEPVFSEPEQPGQETARIFDYNYLGKEEPAAAGTGAGGWFPIPDTGAAAITPPTGVTFAPVVLSAKMKPPVTGLITSAFGYRDHPLTEARDFHNGLDIAAEEGRSILAALPGIVVEVGDSQIYGNYIILEHADNLKTMYAHCSEILAAEGAVINRGERIAKVGATGVVTGPHLHFSVLVNGVYADPYWVLMDNIKVLE